jgi:hypothetical protein
LVYTGDDGVARTMRIPDGEFGRVVEVYMKKDFVALGRYGTLEGGGGAR